MFALLQVEWEPFIKYLGIPGVLLALAVTGLIAGAKWFKSTIESTLTDARKERDAARQLLESQANKFLESSARRDDVMEKGFDEILHEIRSNQHPRRK